jgi:signal peptidase II
MNPDDVSSRDPSSEEGRPDSQPPAGEAGALAPGGAQALGPTTVGDATPDSTVGDATPGAEPGDEAANFADGATHPAPVETRESAHLPATPSHLPVEGQPTFLLFGVVASVSLLLDVSSKGWAEVKLIHRPTTPITLIEDHLSLTLAYNPGGAWGLLTDQSEDIRKPFFVFVSVAAILFIVSLYSRLAPGQRALTWGLPLVLGGALGNLADRITRSQVIDFIDYRADWVRSMNELIAKYVSGWSVTDHWPTFNVADIAICLGVGLMAVDMITSLRGSYPHGPTPQKPEPPGPEPSAQVPPAAGAEGAQPQS